MNPAHVPFPDAFLDPPSTFLHFPKKTWTSGSGLFWHDNQCWTNFNLEIPEGSRLGGLHFSFVSDFANVESERENEAEEANIYWPDGYHTDSE